MDPDYLQDEVGELEAAYHDGLITKDELLSAGGEEFGHLVMEAPVLALRVADRFGGQRGRIPTCLNGGRNNLFIKGLDEADAQKIIDIYRGSDIVVPIFSGLRAALRRQMIINLYKSEMTVQCIAELVNVSERRVYQVLRRAVRDSERRLYQARQGKRSTPTSKSAQRGRVRHDPIFGELSWRKA
ncbi:helix-turn-helix domain-containing protein [Pusillimonas noertemannii]|uniref:Mor transcription activator family protein n=1 Tax=Pusillimonas noertemannii TaxID=305977 RepID=A0A2U1CMX2_9BURK|nr:helix-turn-helix domain-containing protein [Pusillimonas noertemannii]NYT68698.1 helix-turn-helix domain-containing protein [Pusillimonas noertemannii]PVY62284.1 hypothetical protein C7440_1777 [Pusillimonas noertemannii]TFL10741.1 helix-turn-helix domain-containing protein [Pusillimonas noertemannii]